MFGISRASALGLSVSLACLGTAVWFLHPQEQCRAEADCAREHGESAAEILAVHDALYRQAGVVPPGAVRKALAQKQAMQAANIAGAGGTWTPYGVGNLRVVGGAYDNLGARVDNFDYDPVRKRLFAAIGTGGIWMSEAPGGDITKLGDQWVSVGDKLPSQIVSGVAWSAANGGTLIAVGGESVMGSGGYLGLGGFWSDDLGQTWHQASGIPDAALTFRAMTDPAHPEIIYAATSKGLFRSADAGHSYVNVRLPTTEDCVGEEALGPCQFTNYVSDLAIKLPGGATSVACDAKGCPVVAAVGFRTGNGLAFQDGRPMAPANGLYRSDTGEPGTFKRIEVQAPDTNVPLGFTPQNRIGRISLGAATGESQDHNYLYALVEDAVLFNGGFPNIEPPLDLPALPLPVDITPSNFNGAYVSSDFGQNWVRMADTAEINNPATGSEIAVLGPLGGSGAGNQAWYNLWITADPTRTSNGVPTRLTFGLEEVWQNRLTNVPLDGTAQQGPADFEVIGKYDGLTNVSTTHPDQHGSIYVPTGDGGVCLFAGGDGGVFRQCAATGVEMDNDHWGPGGVNAGIYALLPYGLAIAKDGTVWTGYQDNGSGHIEPSDSKTPREIFMDFGSDGFYAETDPDNSNVSYTESQNGGLRRTTDRGKSSSSIAPNYTKVQFDNWFRMDPIDAQHMVTAAQEIYETAHAQTVTGNSWVQVFNLGTNPDTGAVRTTTNIAVQGDAIYVGGCGDCGISGNDKGFHNVIATNIGGDKPPKRLTHDGWHFATAHGLDNRFITGIDVDPADPRTIYVTLGGYLSGLRPPGSYLDPNAGIGSGNVFKSTDAGENFADVSGNLPHVHVHTVVLRGNQLLVGTDIGAFISSDTQGGDWAPLGSGLPNTPVHMLRLQPGNSKHVFAATFGRGTWDYELKDAPAVDVPTTHPRDTTRFGGALSLSLFAMLGALLGLRRVQAGLSAR